MHGDEAVVVILALVIVSGVGLMIAAMFNRRRDRELAHRERLAMIERGLIPSPERNPAAFESAAGLAKVEESAAGNGYRTAGVMMIGIGLGLMMLIAFAAGEPGVGFGVGGAFTTLGVASLLNYSLLSRRAEERDRLQWSPPPRRDSTIPPGNS